MFLSDKRIVFYTGENFLPFFSDHIFHSYEEVKKAIEEKESLIRTTQLCFLQTSLLEKGYDIFICEPNKVFRFIHLEEDGTIFCDDTERELKMSHNLFNLWKSGEFNT